MGRQILADRCIYLSEIDKLYNNFPEKGKTVRIKYNCEYKGPRNPRKKRNRKGKVVQKVHKGARSNFTVELAPEGEQGDRGVYRLNFHMVDILTGLIKVTGVD